MAGASTMAATGEPPPYPNYFNTWYQQTYCPCCGRAYGPTYNYTYTTNHTAPLTFSPERVERWAMDQGEDGTEALRPDEV
jgi:hypothetical protein